MKNKTTNTLKVFSGFLTAAIIFTAFCCISVSAQTTHTFSNTNQINITDFEAANPYPSSLTVSGIQGSATTRFKVKIKRFSHTYPDDVGVLLVAPDGKKIRIFTDCLGAGASAGTGVSNLDLTFDDFAADPLPDNPGNATVSGTYQPKEGTDDGSSAPHPASFFAPAPPAPYNNALASLNGVNPNGVWRLYVDDDTAKDGGAIAGGWELSFQTTPPTAAAAVISGFVHIAGSSLAGARLTLTDSSGGQTVVYSDPFNQGYYELPAMPSGQTYILTVAAKGRTFTPSSQVVSLTGDTTINFNGQ